MYLEWIAIVVNVACIGAAWWFGDRHGRRKVTYNVHGNLKLPRQQDPQTITNLNIYGGTVSMDGDPSDITTLPPLGFRRARDCGPHGFRPDAADSLKDRYLVCREVIRQAVDAWIDAPRRGDTSFMQVTGDLQKAMDDLQKCAVQYRHNPAPPPPPAPANECWTSPDKIVPADDDIVPMSFGRMPFDGPFFRPTLSAILRYLRYASRRMRGWSHRQATDEKSDEPTNPQ